MAMYYKTCPRCKTKFKTRFGQKKYCSPDCLYTKIKEDRAKRLGVVLVERICKACAVPISIYRTLKAKFCSQTCMIGHHNNLSSKKRLNKGAQ